MLQCSLVYFSLISYAIFGLVNAAQGPEWNDEIFVPMPEIKHTFNQPEPMPAASISTIYAALSIVLPWVLFFSIAKKSLSKIEFQFSNISLHERILFVVLVYYMAALAVYWFGPYADASIFSFLNTVFGFIGYVMIPSFAAIGVLSRFILSQ